ncbi:MAG TPA: phage major capsid protein [Gaiella sp.]
MSSGDSEHDSGHSARPFGAKPFGAKPFGAKPFGAKPFGAKPFGAKPFGAKPFGAKPFGAKPFGAKAGDEGEGCPSDPGQRLAELVCERSTVIRMGATLVLGPPLQVPAFEPDVGFRAPGAGGPGPGATVELDDPLRPGDWMLEAGVEVPERLVASIDERAELAESFLVDLADSLAVAVDRACLGTIAGGPDGIDPLVGASPGMLLDGLKDIVKATRAVRPPRNAGWILHPDALDTIGRFVLVDRTVDGSQLLKLDGADGGTLLGFPFLTTTAASEGNDARAYFSVDWQEAWLGVESYLVDLYASGEPAPAAGSILLRASLPFDFALRVADAFAWTVPAA